VARSAESGLRALLATCWCDTPGHLSDSAIGIVFLKRASGAGRKKRETMNKAQDVSQEPRINLPELLFRLDDDRELLRELLAIFKEDFPQHLHAFRDAVASQDMKQTKTVSHTLKGMLSNLAVAEPRQPREAGDGGVRPVEELLYEVDATLYAAKAAGRNCIRIARPNATGYEILVPTGETVHRSRWLTSF